MKLKFFIIIIFIFSYMSLQSQSELTESSTDVNNTKGELGLVLGTPAGGNLIGSIHFDSMLLKGSLGYFGSGNVGYQLELGYKYKEYENTYHAVSVGVGYFDHDTFEYSSFSYGKIKRANRWQYVSINYIVNTYGFYFSGGLSAGTGTMSLPVIMLQLGYAYKFN